MSKTFDKIEQDFSDAGDDYVLDAAESEDSVSDDDSPTGELFSRGEKISDAFSSFSSQTTTVSDAHGDATSLKDVAHSISSYAHHRRRRLATFTHRHRIAVGILSILFLAALSALVVAFVRTNDIPSVDAVTNDARTHVSTPTWTPGAYDSSIPRLRKNALHLACDRNKDPHPPTTARISYRGSLPMMKSRGAYRAGL